jgi:hypothetical protein
LSGGLGKAVQGAACAIAQDAGHDALLQVTGHGGLCRASGKRPKGNVTASGDSRSCANNHRQNGIKETGLWKAGCWIAG